MESAKPTLPNTFKISPKFLILSRSQPTHASIILENSTNMEAHSNFRLNLAHRRSLVGENVRINSAKKHRVQFEIPSDTPLTSPVKIGFVTTNYQCFPVILPVVYVEKLEKSPECKICYLPYNEATVIPKSLPCGHTVCEFCTLRLNRRENGKKIDCPICRKPIDVSEGIRNLPCNFTVLEGIRDRQPPLPPRSRPVPLKLPRIPCCENSSHESDVFCMDCSFNFCQGCFDSIHSARALTSHFKIQVSFPMCHAPNHEGEHRSADAVCVDPRCSFHLPICIPCLLRDHQCPEEGKSKKLHNYESILKNMEENQKVLIDVKGVVQQKEQEIKKLMKRKSIGVDVAEEMKNDLLEIRELKDFFGLAMKSKSLIFLAMDWFEKATEMCNKVYEIEPPSPGKDINYSSRDEAMPENTATCQHVEEPLIDNVTESVDHIVAEVVNGLIELLKMTELPDAEHVTGNDSCDFALQNRQNIKDQANLDAEHTAIETEEMREDTTENFHSIRARFNWIDQYSAPFRPTNRINLGTARSKSKTLGLDESSVSQVQHTPEPVNSETSPDNEMEKSMNEMVLQTHQPNETVKSETPCSTNPKESITETLPSFKDRVAMFEEKRLLPIPKGIISESVATKKADISLKMDLQELNTFVPEDSTEPIETEKCSPVPAGDEEVELDLEAPIGGETESSLNDDENSERQCTN